MWERGGNNTLLFVVKGMKRYLLNLQEAAEHHRPIITKLGIPGLFFFVLTPFWMTGPVVGCIIGYLLGLRHWMNLSVVIAGTCFAIVGWNIIIDRLNESLVAVWLTRYF